MNFKFTDEQLMIRDVVREFAKNEVEPIAQEIDEECRYPAETVKKMGEMGLMGLLVPTKYGGSGADAFAYAIAMEEIARVCASTAVILSVHNSLACYGTLTFGNEEQKRKYLVPLAQGKHLGAFALTEAGAGTDAAAQRTVAVKDGDNYIVNGAKIFITNGPVADTFIVTAMTDKSKGIKGISAFLMEKGMEGFSIGTVENTMGMRGTQQSEIVFDNVKVPEENLLSKEGDGFKIAMTVLDCGRIGIASQGLGIAQGALDESVKYANERVQFNKKIGKFQAIAFMIADMETKVQAARHLVYAAAHAKETQKKFSKEAAMAKLYATETAVDVTTKAIQVHGGYGYIKDYAVERYFRDARITTIYEGTSEVQKMVISRSLGL